MKLIVEGGGPTRATQTHCRAGFEKYVAKLIPDSKRKPRIIASGSRVEAYKDFCRELKSRTSESFPVLLVDSEDRVDPRHRANPWEHLAQREGDRWPQPNGATPEQAQLMVVYVESWIASDRQALARYYGKGFEPNALPPTDDFETLPKPVVLDSLKKATCATKAGEYDKSHAFELVGLIDPHEVVKRCRYFAPRFHQLVKERCG